MSNIYSSGVLPYCKCYDGNVYFLLGRDYDNKWSDFGGRSELKDKGEIEATASREFWEESLGCIDDFETIRVTLKYKKIPMITSKTQAGYPYYMYLLKVPYSMNYRQNFTTTRNFISKTDIDKKYLEKYDVRWVSLDTLKYTINVKSMISLRSIFQATITNYLQEIEKKL
jgi:hypothetical protein